VEVAAAFPALPVVLSGGCFQNRHLLQGCVRRLEEKGREVYWNEDVPPNDGGLSYGQLAAAGFRWA